MYIVIIGWLYVALMMAVTEATSSTGSILGAMVTFVLYGLLPALLLMYLLGTPARRRAIKAREAAQAEAARASDAPDAGGEAAGDALAPERKEP